MVKKKIDDLDLEDESLEIEEVEDESVDDSFEDDDFYGDDDGSPLSKHNDLLKQLTNFNPYLEEIFNSWLGLYWDKSEEVYKRDENINPIMSVKCAAWCLSFLKTYARENNIITDISYDDYKNLVEDIIDVVWLNLGTREDLNIEDEGDLIRVCTEMEHAAQLVLMGAGDGKYNKFLGTTITRHETIRPEGLSPSVTGVPVRNKGVIGKIKKVLVGD